MQDILVTIPFEYPLLCVDLVYWSSIDTDILYFINHFEVLFVLSE